MRGVLINLLAVVLTFVFMLACYALAYIFMVAK